MKKLYITSLLLSLILLPPTTLAKADQCEKYKDKYKAIQAKQRQSNTVKKSNQLKDKELKALHKWQRCKQGKLK